MLCTYPVICISIQFYRGLTSRYGLPKDIFLYKIIIINNAWYMVIKMMAIKSDKKLSRKEAAKELCVSPQTLANWASNGKIDIPYHKIGKRKVFYYQSDIDAYIASTRTTHAE